MRNPCWPVGTLATQLSLHPDLVRRVLGQGNHHTSGMPRVKTLDPFREFIQQQFAQYPQLCATRIYDMVRERGYRGAVRTVRAYVTPLRPQPRRTIYLRTETLPGAVG